jgi:hypothetical protein
MVVAKKVDKEGPGSRVQGTQYTHTAVFRTLVLYLTFELCHNYKSCTAGQGCRFGFIGVVRRGRIHKDNNNNNGKGSMN